MENAHFRLDFLRTFEKKNIHKTLKMHRVKVNAASCQMLSRQSHVAGDAPACLTLTPQSLAQILPSSQVPAAFPTTCFSVSMLWIQLGNKRTLQRHRSRWACFCIRHCCTRISGAPPNCVYLASNLGEIQCSGRPSVKIENEVSLAKMNCLKAVAAKFCDSAYYLRDISLPLL